MKITKNTLKKLIKEEMENLMDEDMYEDDPSLGNVPSWLRAQIEQNTEGVATLSEMVMELEERMHRLDRGGEAPTDAPMDID